MSVSGSKETRINLTTSAWGGGREPIDHLSVSASHRHQNVVHLWVVEDQHQSFGSLREAVQEAVEEMDSAAVWGFLLAAAEACDPYHV
jgi:hypothetical protein